MLSHIVCALSLLSKPVGQVFPKQVLYRLAHTYNTKHFSDVYRVTVVIPAPAGKEKELATIIQDVQTHSLVEPGCQEFTVHTDTSDAVTKYVLIERWKNENEQRKQLAKPYVKAAEERLRELGVAEYSKYMGHEVQPKKSEPEDVAKNTQSQYFIICC